MLPTKKLWDDGIPALTLQGNHNESYSAYTSTHRRVNKATEKSFSICDSINDKLSPEGLKKNSDFLNNSNVKKGSIEYNNEADIEVYVRNISQDVMALLGIDDECSFNFQATLVSVTDADLKKESKSDIWVVKTKSGMPFLIIEVKQPGQSGKSKLTNTKVLGQVFDYMCDLRNSFGQCEVFAVVSSLEEFVVC